MEQAGAKPRISALCERGVNSRRTQPDLKPYPLSLLQIGEVFLQTQLAKNIFTCF